MHRPTANPGHFFRFAAFVKGVFGRSRRHHVAELEARAASREDVRALIRVAEACCEEDPERALATYWRAARRATERGEYTKALGLHRRIVTLDVRDVAAHTALAESFAALERFVEAGATLRVAGALMEADGRPDAARHLFERADRFDAQGGVDAGATDRAQGEGADERADRLEARGEFSPAGPVDRAQGEGAEVVADAALGADARDAEEAAGTEIIRVLEAGTADIDVFPDAPPPPPPKAKLAPRPAYPALPTLPRYDSVEIYLPPAPRFVPAEEPLPDDVQRWLDSPTRRELAARCAAEDAPRAREHSFV